VLKIFGDDASGRTIDEIAHSFRWLGWTGVCLQAILGFIPILVVVTNVLVRTGQQAGGFSLGLVLAIVCIIILVFSAFWCFRYTRLADKLQERELRPAKARVIQDVRIGLVANIGMMAIAVVIALWRVGALTLKMLTLPQGATVVAPNQLGTTVTSSGALITPSNMIAIQAMVSTIAAGLAGVVIALMLLHQIGQHRNS
jgi:hypothetical protein